MAEQDQQFVEYVVKSIVNNPDQVEVSRKTDEMGVLLRVKVAPTDMALLIGRSGATAKALRTLARIVGMKNNARVNIQIIEPEGSTRGQRQETEAPAVEQQEKTRDIDDVVNEIGA